MNQAKNITQRNLKAVESPPLTDEILARMRPVVESHPEIPPRVRGPQKTPPKKITTIRLNAEVVDYFRSQGKGWQTKINDVLQGYVDSMRG